MSERTTPPHSHLTRHDVAHRREEPPTAARRNPGVSPTDLAVVEADNLLQEVLELTSRLEEARETISRLEEVIVSLQERCTTDPLTGAYNRRACEERLAQDVARASRGGGTLTLAILDADNLKEVNDRWGHQAGDACLKHLADALERNSREGDWIARWGGDEFVVIFWEDKGQNEGTMLQRIGEDLQRNPVRLVGRGEEVRMSFSAGVCRHRGEGKDAGELFSRADAALLEAKKGGPRRDRRSVLAAPNLRGQAYSPKYLEGEFPEVQIQYRRTIPKLQTHGRALYASYRSAQRAPSRVWMGVR